MPDLNIASIDLKLHMPVMLAPSFASMLIDPPSSGGDEGSVPVPFHPQSPGASGPEYHSLEPSLSPTHNLFTLTATDPAASGATFDRLSIRTFSM